MTVAELRRANNLPADPARRGPVPLGQFFDELGVAHVAMPALTRGAVTDEARRRGYFVNDPGDPRDMLAGMLYFAGRAALAFVNAADILPRRRFTAAHELGHFVLHRDRMGSFHGDTDETIREAIDDGEAVAMEREANRFAAELLMPAEMCAARADELRHKHRCCPRTVLTNLLASELLVSLQAAGYRLKQLGLGDE